MATKREDSIILKVRSFTRGTLVDAVDYKSVRLWSFLLDGFNFALAKLLKHPIHLGAWEKPTLFPFYTLGVNRKKNSLSECLIKNDEAKFLKKNIVPIKVNLFGFEIWNLENPNSTLLSLSNCAEPFRKIAIAEKKIQNWNWTHTYIYVNVWVQTWKKI